MKKTELRDRIANVTLQMEVVVRERGEQGDLAIKTFELSQALEKKWLTAGFAEKRKLLEIVFSNFRLDGVSLCYEINKPFDVLAKGLVVPSDRSNGTPVELFLHYCSGIKVFRFEPENL